MTHSEGVTPHTGRPVWIGRFAAVAVIALLCGLVAWFTGRQNSSTFDEPVHAYAAIATVQGHLEINPEHPPLWKYLAGLPNRGEQIDLSEPTLAQLRSNPVAQWPWAVEGLYRTGGVNGEKLVGRARGAMVLFTVALVIVVGCFAGRLLPRSNPRGKTLAAVLAALLLGLEPLVLGHGVIVSNDVAVTLWLVCGLWVSLEMVWSETWRRTALFAVVLGMVLAAGVTTKFTGVLGYAVALCVIVAGTWRAYRIQHLPMASKVAGLLLAFALSYGGIWAIYGFENRRLNDIEVLADRVGRMRLIAEGKDPVTSRLPPPDMGTRVLSWMYETGVVPRPMSAGLMMSYAVTRSNPAFAAGRYSTTGWWWYFPFATLVKEPMGILGLWGLAAGWAYRNRKTSPALSMRLVWGGAAVILIGSVASPLNIGLRHFLPVIGVVTVGVAVVMAMSWERLKWAVIVLLGVVVVEVGASFPRYIAFFNGLGKMIGPERLLADSNIDWGQDLKRLAVWRAANPDGKLYLAYWGTVDPAAKPYQLDAVHLPGSYEYAPQAVPTEPGYVAVSVTYLQGMNSGGTPLPFYRKLLAQPPLAKVGDSIYIWAYRP